LRTCALSSKKVRSRQLQHNSHDPAAAVSQHHRASHPIWLPRAFDPSFDVSIIVSISGRPGLGATCLSLTFRHAGGGTMGHGTWNMELISRVKAVLPPPSYTQRRIVCSHYASPPLPFLPHRLAASYRSAPSVTPCPVRGPFGCSSASTRQVDTATAKFCFCIAGLPLLARSTG
jgi:hypothetical protein